MGIRIASLQNINRKMMKIVKQLSLLLLLLTLFAACNSNSAGKKQEKARVVKGLYSYGPEIRSFTDCDEAREYWVIDSANTLELAYSNMNFEKPYEPVYIEVECKVVKSDSLMVTADYDSTMVVTKLLKMTKEIPDGPCNQ
jgi:copper homeostasis protein (lipoprotein)